MKDKYSGDVKLEYKNAVNEKAYENRGEYSKRVYHGENVNYQRTVKEPRNNTLNGVIENLNQILSIAAIMFIYGIFTVTDIGCPIKFITGISCIGCGMTRAWMSLLHFDIKEAFYFHPAFWLPPFVLAVLYLKYRNQKIILKYYNFIVFFVIAVFVVVYIFRVIWSNNDIVVIQPENNILSRTLQKYIY